MFFDSLAGRLAADPRVRVADPRSDARHDAADSQSEHAVSDDGSALT